MGASVPFFRCFSGGDFYLFLLSFVFLGLLLSASLGIFVKMSFVILVLFGVDLVFFSWRSGFGLFVILCVCVLDLSSRYLLFMWHVRWFLWSSLSLRFLDFGGLL